MYNMDNSMIARLTAVIIPSDNHEISKAKRPDLKYLKGQQEATKATITFK